MDVDDLRRAVPRTDAVLSDERLVAAAARLGRDRVKRTVVAVLQRVRVGELPPQAAADEAVRALPAIATSLRPVLNATGVLLHTNLGRAPLSMAAVEAVVAASGYVDLEFDLTTGRRAPRGQGVLAALRRAVPHADDVLVVNNGAAVLVLATTALAQGREVVVARGEMVEIGDGFRLPELVASTGARLREVGTTNRVRRADYAAAIDPETGAILKVHPSNFRVEGFTSSVSVAELASLGPPVIGDIGSGLLCFEPRLPDEPDVDSWLSQGAAVVTCSGDKLLGGPQAGLLFGTADLVTLLRRHPLGRALRVDKLTLAALEATMGGAASPIREFLAVNPSALQERCATLAAVVGGDVVPAVGVVGGGGAPGVSLPGWAVALPTKLAARLRTGRPPVIGRVEGGRLLLDLRCVPPSFDAALTRAVLAAARV